MTSFDTSRIDPMIAIGIGAAAKIAIKPTIE
jgi:hypothetical protein